MAVHAVVSVTITVADDAMQTPGDVADALYQAANALVAGGRSLADIDRGPSIRIRDRNGNTVGHLQVAGYYETKEQDR